ncbi:MAG: hypothetical protein COS99_03935 [Candidatus Omnitrophica bacterium CG07_land_8_20_14_0_80_42_15]|uniref:Uncharacterized protein n=1 Tax=Candidatus Aquitaenariimonas noxiae TaxID=1974741 RepID=A0A2J0KVB1_9BACT|nr:MAG: hypothetical protein COS99_03935 [Candidatus Omnitrophica bacterium CG07_land_8_20_14_0_80_42_15]
MDSGLKNQAHWISALRLFYLLNALLATVTFIIFHKYIGIMLVGISLPPIGLFFAEFLFILLPLYMYIAFEKPGPGLFSIVLSYHSFFIINSIFTIYDALHDSSVIPPLLQLVNINAESLDDGTGIGYTLNHISVHTLNIFVGFVILFYILLNYNLFFKRSEQK